MDASPQYKGLIATLWISLVLAIIVGIISAVIDPVQINFAGSYIDDGQLAMKSSLAALSNVLLIVAAVAAIGAAVLAGVRHMLEQSKSAASPSESPQAPISDGSRQ